MRRDPSLEEQTSEEIIFASVNFRTGKPSRQARQYLTTSDQNALDAKILVESRAINFSILKNPNLQAKHFRHLLSNSMIQDNEVYRSLLLKNPSFPTDLLEELASNEVNPLVLRIIADHNNTSEDDKIIAILRGATNYVDYLKTNPYIEEKAESVRLDAERDRLHARKRRWITGIQGAIFGATLIVLLQSHTTLGQALFGSKPPTSVINTHVVPIPTVNLPPAYKVGN